jgi:drug/metabolite transporter (DMT)-like permease
MTFRTKCLLLLIVTAALWSTAGVSIKTIEWNPLAIASSRSLVAGLFMAFLARKQKIFSRRPSKNTLAGAVALALVSICFVSATKLTTAANAILLQYTAPIWVALAAPFILKERTRGLDWFFIALTAGGMALFFMDSLSAEGFWGIIIAIGCSLAFAGMAIAMRFNKTDGPPFAMMVYGNMMVFLAGLYFWQPPWPTFRDVIIIVLLGVFQFGLAYHLFALASQGVTSLELVLITALEPILNPILVFLFLGERPGLWALLGGSVVLLSVTAWSVIKTKRQPI